MYIYKFDLKKYITLLDFTKTEILGIKKFTNYYLGKTVREYDVAIYFILA